RRKWPSTAMVVVSAHAVGGNAVTIRALELGAFDFVTKPAAASPKQAKAELAGALSHVVGAFRSHTEARTAEEVGRTPSAPRVPLVPQITPALRTPNAFGVPNQLPKQTVRAEVRARAEVVVIGVSIGGPHALAQVLPQLPGDLAAPILVVQHMPPIFTRSLAASLDAKCSLRVKEGEDGETVKPRTVYLAPGGKHMKVTPTALGGGAIRITDDPPENGTRPSVDYLLRSAADAYPGRACAVIMTGMGNDGTLGLGVLKRTGCHVIAQDAQSSAVHGMAQSAIAAGLVDVIVPLESIATQICRSVLGW
ncbi:chemotaxis protein CheB, partial [Myxococcota bacterium]